MPNELNPDCFARHSGPWAIYPQVLIDAVAAIRSGRAPVESAAQARSASPRDGVIAFVPIIGTMLKGKSKFEGTVNTLDVRREIRAAAAAQDVAGIILLVDSPGGHVDGTSELADDIKAAAKAKPVFGFGEDLVASAALWVISQTDRVIVNAMGKIGSIGAFMSVVDSSEKMERDGLKVRVIKSEGIKGAGIPGVPITEEVIDDIQKHVDFAADTFVRTVASGRGIPLGAVRKLATGELFTATEAVANGLVDQIGTFEEAVRQLRAEIRGRGQASRARAQARVKVAELSS